MLTDISVAYTIVDSLEDNRGEHVWVWDLEEFIDNRIKELEASTSEGSNNG